MALAVEPTPPQATTPEPTPEAEALAQDGKRHGPDRPHRSGVYDRLRDQIFPPLTAEEDAKRRVSSLASANT